MLFGCGSNDDRDGDDKSQREDVEEIAGDDGEVQDLIIYLSHLRQRIFFAIVPFFAFFDLPSPPGRVLLSQVIFLIASRIGI